MAMHVEHKLLFYRKEVVRCIKEPTVVSHLEADAILSRDDSSKLRTMYLQGQCFKANEEMIDLLLKSSSKGKWRTFLHALDRSEYGYLKSLLESKNRKGESDARAREIIRVFSPYLEKAISAKDIITELYSRNVINDVDRDEIATAYQNKGDMCATIVLLERMQCRLAPDEWYYKFLCTLVESGFQHVVKQIEPDYLDCPEQFKPSADKLQPHEQRGCSESLISPFITTHTASVSFDETCEVDSGSQSITEHIMTDSVDCEEEMDDQGVPEKMEDMSCEGNANRERNISCLEDFDSDCPKSLENTEKTETEFSFVETCEYNKSSPSLEKLGERKQPEGQEICVSSSSDSVENDTQSNTKGSNNTESFGSVQGERYGLEIIDAVSPEDSFNVDSANDDYQPLEKKLYPFQLELAEKALDGKNTIVCAPTGCGKTWVAIYIIDRHLNSTKYEKKKVAFMARNGALVKQQVDRLSAELAYARVKHIVGDTDESMMVQAFIDDYDVFFFTPQILVNNLSKDLKKVSVFSLLVFDECHHVKGAEPYKMLMNQYLLEQSEGIKDLPQIVGLTASIGTGRAKSENDALDHIFRICANLDVRCLSLVERNKEDLAKHVSLPSEEIVPTKKRPIDPCRGILLEALRETQEFLFEKFATVPMLIPVLFKRPKEIETNQYGSWVAEVVKFGESFQNAQGRDIASCGNYLQTYHNALEVNKLLRTQDVAIYIAKQQAQDAEHLATLTEIEKYLLNKMKDVQNDLLKVDVENPTIQDISKLLTNLFAEDDGDSRAMIFVQARATSRALAEYLNQNLDKIFVKASSLIGKESRGSDEGMTEEEQTRIINDFREGTLKILVATSVGMEGLDVPDCNLILSYNFTRDEITKIQMPGRSRKKGGKSLMIGTDEQLQKDKIAMYRITLMKAAIKEFMKLDKNTINRKVLTIQKKELDDYKWSLKARNLKRSKLSDEVDYTIRCKRCGMLICNTSNVRKLETSHLVALKDFEEKIRKEAHTKRQNMGSLKKKYKMFCKKCPNDWGVIADKDGMQFFVLKAESLRFVSCVDQNDVTSYKEWPEVPYKFKDINFEDLANIYGDSN